MTTAISILQAYCSVLDYLDKYYLKTYSDDIGDLAGDMHFIQDGRTVDDAAWNDWLRAIHKVKPSLIVNQNENVSLTINEAYSAMIYFLENYAYLTNSAETRKLLDEIMALKDGKPVDQENWNEWMLSVKKILAQKPLIKPLLILTK